MTISSTRTRRSRRSSSSAIRPDRKSTRLNSSHQIISYAVFCLKKKKTTINVSHHPSPSAPCLQASNIPVYRPHTNDIGRVRTHHSVPLTPHTLHHLLIPLALYD